MLFSRSNDGIEADEFWRSREEAIGSTILGKTLGRVIRENPPAPLWGLFYTTKDAVYFQTFKSENWVSMILTSGKGSNRTKDETIEIPRAAVKSFSIKERKGGFFKVFRQPPLVVLEWTDPESGEENSMLFEMEGDAQAFVDSFNG